MILGETRNRRRKHSIRVRGEEFHFGHTSFGVPKNIWIYNSGAQEGYSIAGEGHQEGVGRWPLAFVPVCSAQECRGNLNSYRNIPPKKPGRMRI